jgi:hypothetical protein
MLEEKELKNTSREIRNYELPWTPVIIQEAYLLRWSQEHYRDNLV